MQQQKVASCASESVPERMQLPASAGEPVKADETPTKAFLQT